MVKKTSLVDNTERIDFAVLLRNASLYNNLLEIISSTDNDLIGIKKQTYSISGRVLKSFNDNQTHKWFYVMIRDYED
jgi:hypothetical protein